MGFDLTILTKIKQYNPNAQLWDTSSLSTENSEWVRSERQTMPGVAFFESKSSEGELVVTASSQGGDEAEMSDHNLTRLVATQGFISDNMSFTSRLSFDIVPGVIVKDAAGQDIEMKCYDYSLVNAKGEQYHRRIAARANQDISVFFIYNCPSSSWSEQAWNNIVSNLKFLVEFEPSNRPLSEIQMYDLPDSISLDKLSYAVVAAPDSEWAEFYKTTFPDWSLTVQNSPMTTFLNLHRGEEVVTIQVTATQGMNADSQYPNNQAIAQAVYGQAVSEGAREYSNLQEIPVSTINGQIFWMQSSRALFDESGGLFRKQVQMTCYSAFVAHLNGAYLINYTTKSDAWSMLTWADVIQRAKILAVVGVNETP